MHSIQVPRSRSGTIADHFVLQYMLFRRFSTPSSYMKNAFVIFHSRLLPAEPFSPAFAPIRQSGLYHPLPVENEIVQSPEPE